MKPHFVLVAWLRTKGHLQRHADTNRRTWIQDGMDAHSEERMYESTRVLERNVAMQDRMCNLQEATLVTSCP
jgi:hypothetical protein